MANKAKIKIGDKEFSASQIINAVSNSVNKRMGTNLGSVSSETIGEMSSQLRSAPQLVANGWQDTLVNLVGLQYVLGNRSFESYFRKLHKSAIKTFDIQLMMADLLDVKSYSSEANADEFFEDAKADIKTQYISSPLRKVIPLSVNEESMYGAFISEQAFSEFFASMSNVMYNTMEMLDLEQTNALINTNVTSGNIYIIPLAKPVDKDTALAFTKAMKVVTKDMASIMSPKYNISHINAYTPKDMGMFITDNDIESVTETYSLAWAFNKEFLDFANNGNGISVASDTLAYGKIYAMYTDVDAFQIRNIEGFPKTTSQYFGNTLTLKRWLHYWAMYAMSCFSNAVAFADPSNVGITGATLALNTGSTAMNKGANAIVKVDAITVTSGKIGDKFGTFSIAGNSSTDTTIDSVTGAITIGKNETASTVTVTFTSHLDSTVTGTLAITVNA